MKRAIYKVAESVVFVFEAAKTIWVCLWRWRP